LHYARRVLLDHFAIGKPADVKTHRMTAHSGQHDQAPGAAGELKIVSPTAAPRPPFTFFEARSMKFLIMV